MDVIKTCPACRHWRKPLVVFLLCVVVKPCFAEQAKHELQTNNAEQYQAAQAVTEYDPAAEYAAAQRAAYRQAVSDMMWLFCIPFVALLVLFFKLWYTPQNIPECKSTLEDVKLIKARVRQKRSLPGGWTERTRDDA